MSLTKQSVVVFGATGRTGQSIINALIEAGNFELYAAVRAASQHKPEVESLRSKGVSVVLSDLAVIGDSVEAYNALVTILKGKDTVISMTDFAHLDWQITLANACKEAGVKRYIPCDVGSSCVRGVRIFFDEKLAVHDHIEKIGLGHTYVDVGLWFQLMLPVTDPAKAAHPQLIERTQDYFVRDDGKKVKSAMTDLPDIGRFFARIIPDERTLNRYVFCWSQEKTQEEIWELVEKIVGKEMTKLKVTESALVERNEKAIQESNLLMIIIGQYMYSVWIRGDNTVENAKKPEYGNALDARELYPDFKPKTLEEFAQEVYGPGGEHFKLGY